MTLIYHLYLWLTSEPTHRVSAHWLAQHERMACRRGVDLPRWRFPKERAR